MQKRSVGRPLEQGLFGESSRQGTTADRIILRAGRPEDDQSTAQNFVDIMFKIHNKFQNIKSLTPNERRSCWPWGETQAKGLLFMVGVSGLAKIVCLSKI